MCLVIHSEEKKTPTSPIEPKKAAATDEPLKVTHAHVGTPAVFYSVQLASHSKEARLTQQILTADSQGYTVHSYQ